ncbi:MAG TPA: hypothetical protein VL361_27060 [Candidatus Limnocylindrales bacterium]|jgi:hypothetical protein|nr:hypothetical protein [Candidatus Limnocylindrales bacterium]
MPDLSFVIKLVPPVVVAITLTATIVLQAIRILHEYERRAIFRLSVAKKISTAIL